jgi:hypothetical protein
LTKANSATNSEICCRLKSGHNELDRFIIKLSK